MSENDDTSRAVRLMVMAFRTNTNAPAFPRRRSNILEIDAARETLSAAGLETARFRPAKAKHFPGDDRNLPAAELLERIAGTVSEVPDCLMRQYEEAWHEEIALRTLDRCCCATLASAAQPTMPPS